MKAYGRTQEDFLLWEMSRILASYRIKMRVRELVRLSDGGYFLCPRCKITLDRDFQNYCDRCGQCLDWKAYRKAKIIFPGDKS